MRQKLKIAAYSDRDQFNLLAYNFAFNLCRVVFEQFNTKNWNGNGKKRCENEGITV